MLSLKNRMDLHIHTDNSEDGFHPTVLMCEYAIRGGVRAVAITDHCECNRYRQDRFDRSIRQSYVEARKAKSIFSGRLVVLAGLELGQPLQNVDAADDALDACEYDFVLGSLHNVAGQPDFHEIDYSVQEWRPLLDRYFEELYAMVHWGQFDCLAHLTYPLRYMVGIHQIQVDINQWHESTDEILRLLAQNGKALEINTSGYRQPYGRPLPEEWAVRRFRELGGELITIGSDAHCCKDIGLNIEDGMRLAWDAGFHGIALYEQRQPLIIPME